MFALDLITFSHKDTKLNGNMLCNIQTYFLHTHIPSNKLRSTVWFNSNKFIGKYRESKVK